jgi:hypothetical protein
MVRPAGEAQSDALRLDFERRLKLEFHGSSVTSDAGLLAYRELDDALGLTAVAGQHLADSRTGRNGRHDLMGMLRQSVFGRLAGYEDVNNAGRLGRDPAMRWIFGGKAVERDAASTSQMGRFETEWLATDESLAALTGLSGQWIDRVHGHRSRRLFFGVRSADYFKVRQCDPAGIHGRTSVTQRVASFGVTRRCLLTPAFPCCWRALYCAGSAT